MLSIFFDLSQVTQAFEAVYIQHEGEIYLLTRNHVVEWADKGVLPYIRNIFVTLKSSFQMLTRYLLLYFYWLKTTAKQKYPQEVKLQNEYVLTFAV